MLREGLVQRVVERVVLVVVQLVHDEPGGKDGRRRLLGQLDRHLVEAPHLAIAVGLEERTCRGIGLRRAGQNLLHALRARERLAALDDLRPEAAALVGNDAADVRRLAVDAVRRARDHAAVVLPDPRLLAPLQEHEDVRAGEAAGRP